MKEQKLVNILLTAVVILAIGEGYLLYQNAQLRGGVSSRAVLGNSAVTNVAPAEDLGAPPPATPSNTLSPAWGTVTSISSSGFKIKRGAQTVPIAVSSDTAIVSQGNLKDQATQDADMQKFQTYSASLEQDPQKSKIALEHLIAPSPYQETTISLSDLKAGTNVFILGERQSDGSIDAVKIVALPAAN